MKKKKEVEVAEAGAGADRVAVEQQHDGLRVAVTHCQVAGAQQVHVSQSEGSLCCLFFFSSRRRHTRSTRDWSSDVCSSDLRETFETAGELTLDVRVPTG